MMRLERLAASALFWLPVAGESAAMAEETLDQANAPDWTGAAVSISPASNASQSFTPKLECLTEIEVALMTAYRGRGGDNVTVSVQGKTATQLLGASTAAIPEGFDGYWRFRFSPPLLIGTGEPVTFSVADTGKAVFFWKHAGNDPYQPGQASFSGSRFYTNDFLFRTYGAPSGASEPLCRTAQSD
jgi:hypothetical protein